VRTWTLILLLLLAGATRAADPIPVETLFRPAAVDNVSLSPDGAHLAAIVPLAGRRNVAVIDLADMHPHAVTRFDGVDAVDYRWIDNGRVMVDVGDAADASGQVHYRAFGALDLEGKDEQRLKFPSAGILYRFPDGQVLHMGRLGTSSTVYKADTRTGGETLVTFDNPGGVVRWVADFDGNVRAALSYDRKRQSNALYWRPARDGPWKELARFPGEEGEGIVPLAFDADNRNLIVASNVGNDRMAVWRYDPEAAKLLDRIYEGAGVDIGGVIIDRASRRIVGVPSGLGTSGITWLDPHWRALQEAVDQALPGLRNLLSWGEQDSDRILVRSYSDTQPATYWLLDAKSGRLREVQKSRGWIDPARMTPVKQVSYSARDGLLIPAYLALPAHDPEVRPPLVVVIHGGPHVPGYTVGFDPETQFFASRGYAVLLPNFRGTMGYGHQFLAAGYRQWGRAMQDDITDGVRWAIERKLVDPRRVCLYGASYGGYAALMGLVREPAMFRCAVAAFAVTDPALLFEPGWNRSVARDDIEAYLKRTIGDPADERALDAISPLKQAKSIRQPVLLAFGGADPRVAIVHGSRLRSALESGGAPVEWVMYPDEGHGFHKDEDRFDFYRRVEAFLARNLAP